MALRLNLACGKNVKEGWINVDLRHDVEGVERINLLKPWPWGPQSADFVYCEHFLEHLEWPREVDWFLEQAFRVLEVGGVIRLGVPDATLPFQFWDHPIAPFWRHLNDLAPPLVVTRMEKIQWWYRQKNMHKWAYDEESLARMLQRAGFVSPKKRYWNAEYDSKVREIETLYMEARRP